MLGTRLQLRTLVVYVEVVLTVSSPFLTPLAFIYLEPLAGVDFLWYKQCHVCKLRASTWNSINDRSTSSISLLGILWCILNDNIWSHGILTGVYSSEIEPITSEHSRLVIVQLRLRSTDIKLWISE